MALRFRSVLVSGDGLFSWILLKEVNSPGHLEQSTGKEVVLIRLGLLQVSPPSVSRLQLWRLYYCDTNPEVHLGRVQAGGAVSCILRTAYLPRWRSRLGLLFCRHIHCDSLSPPPVSQSPSQTPKGGHPFGHVARLALFIMPDSIEDRFFTTYTDSYCKNGTQRAHPWLANRKVHAVCCPTHP